MSTYLELVNQLKLELGVAGTELTSVANQTAMKKKLVSWVANADIYIQSLHLDWEFLWEQYSQALVVGTAEPVIPPDLGTWDRDSFYLDYSTVNNRHLGEVKYTTWRKRERQGVKQNRKPHQIIIKPNNQPIVDSPPDDTYTLTADYWVTPTKMTVDGSTSVIPVQYERIIIVQAKLWFGEEEEYELVISEAKKELYGERGRENGLLRQLESAQLPEQENRNMAAGPSITVEVE